MEITVDQLVTLESIARHGSFSGAARELGRVTSAVSYTVRTLETTLDLTLFDRGGRRAELTPEGRALLDEARSVLHGVRHLESLAAQLREGWEPALEIVLDGIFPLTPVMRALKRFSRERIPTKVRLMVEYLTGVQERFERDEADLMLALDFENDGTLAARALPEIEMVLLAHRSHPIHKLPKPVDRRALLGHVELVVSDSAVEPRARPLNLMFHATHTFSLSDFHSKREALRGGVGFGWLPRHLARDLIRRGTLIPVGFEEGDTTLFRSHLVHRLDALPGRGGRLFMDYLAAEFERART